jgi:hypothetical protein
MATKMIQIVKLEKSEKRPFSTFNISHDQGVRMNVPIVIDQADFCLKHMKNKPL